MESNKVFFFFHQLLNNTGHNNKHMNSVITIKCNYEDLFSKIPDAELSSLLAATGKVTPECQNFQY